jgi:hypothetical protein
MGWLYLMVPMTLLLLVLAAVLALPLAEGRRKHLLEMRREEARLAEARVKAMELRQRRAELEYREALLELERFDRRTGAGPTTGLTGAPGGSAADPAADPRVPYRPGRPAGAEVPPDPDNVAGPPPHPDRPPGTNSPPDPDDPPARPA